MSNEYLIEDRQSAVELELAAATVFKPRAPISTRDLFSGRWEQITTIADAIPQTGLHIVIFGERGVGKTSLANIIDTIIAVMDEDVRGQKSERLVAKVNVHQGDAFSDCWGRMFDEITMVEDKPIIGIVPQIDSKRVTLREAFGISDQPTIDEVRRALSAIPQSVFIFDEFDRSGANLRTAFTDLIKALSDYAVDSTIVIVGVADTVDHLVKDHASIVRAVVQVKLPRMKEKELKEILEKGGKKLGITFSPAAAALIARTAQGLPHYTHLIGLHSARNAVNRLTRLVDVSDVQKSFEKAVKQAEQSIQHQYLKSTHSAHRDALYESVILACAIASSSANDGNGYFHPADVVLPIRNILDRENVKIATFQKHINEFCEKERGAVLERDGAPRAYKYRFRDPLLPPYIFMTAISQGRLDPQKLAQMTEEG